VLDICMPDNHHSELRKSAGPLRCQTNIATACSSPATRTNRYKSCLFYIVKNYQDMQ